MAPRRTATEQLPPPVSGAETWEVRSWLPAGTELPWLDEIRERHLQAVTAWERAVAEVAAIEDESERLERADRRAVRDAVASGQTAPPPSFDPAVRRALREVGQEEIVVRRDELARLADDGLSECRNRRAELEPHADKISAPFLRALWAGLEGAQERAKSDLRKRLAELEAPPPEPAIKDVTDPASEPTHELQQEVVHA